MSPMMWGLLFVFLVAASITAYLTYALMREWYLSNNPPQKISPVDIKAESEESILDAVLNKSEPLQNANGPEPKSWNGEERVTVLLLGLDLRDWEEENGPSRTDTMILFTADPSTRTAAMLSIPRDLWVNIPGYDYGKINTAHYLGEAYRLEGGGAGLAVKTVEKLLDIDINYYVRVDFNAFVHFIDEIGGIEVNIPEKIRVDPIGPNNNVVLKPGVRKLKGAVALAYARNRDTAGSDFDRAERQQQVILAIREKILSLDMLPTLIKKSPILYKEVASGVQTNLSLDEIIQIAWLASQIPDENIQRAKIDIDQVTQTYSYNGMDILLPDIESVKMMVDELFTDSGPAVPVVSLNDLAELLSAEEATVSVLNATYTPGLAAETTEYLRSNNINVIITGNAKEATSLTTIISYTGKPNTVQYLVGLLNIDASRIYYRNDPNSQVDISILLGDDWAVNNPMP